MNIKIRMAILAFGLILLSACGGGGSSSHSAGTIDVALTDAATTDYQAVYVTVSQVEVQKDGSDGWTVLSTPNKTYNLLELINGVRESLAVTNLADGHYNQMRLILSETPDDTLNILSVKHPYGNYFIDDSGTSVELKVPSGFQTGVKIVKGFDISANLTTELILDFDAARSIVKAGNSGKWLLKPTIKMLATTECSIIEGNAGAEGILISAQIYNASAALADRVQIAAATISDVDGNYRLFLEPGSYTLVGYKDGFAPYYKDTKITATEGSTTTEDFSIASESDNGSLTGSVSISGADAEKYATFSIRQDATVGGNAEQIEVKSFNVANGGTFTTGLPVGNYSAVVSAYDETTTARSFSIAADLTTDIGNIIF